MISYTIKKIQKCKNLYHYGEVDYYNVKIGHNVNMGQLFFKNINRAYKALEKFTKHRDCECVCEVKEN